MKMEAGGSCSLSPEGRSINSILKMRHTVDVIQSFIFNAEIKY